MFDGQLLDFGILPPTLTLTSIVYILSPRVFLALSVSAHLSCHSELHTQPGQFTPCSKALGNVQSPVYNAQGFVHDLVILTSPASPQATVLSHLPS